MIRYLPSTFAEVKRGILNAGIDSYKHTDTISCNTTWQRTVLILMTYIIYQQHWGVSDLLYCFLITHGGILQVWTLHIDFIKRVAQMAMFVKLCNTFWSSKMGYKWVQNAFNHL